jgi:hypothetical protein
LQTLHVNVSSYEGTCSRSSRDSGAFADVGDAALDSNRTADSSLVRASMGEGRMAADVRGVWKRRFAGAGMYSAWELRTARGAVFRAKARNKDDEERIVVDAITNSERQQYNLVASSE